MNHRARKFVFLAPFILPLFLLFIAAGGWVVSLLWNWLLPPLFGWPTIGFWQALGLLALCRILFGGCGFFRSSGSRVRLRMAERWDAMTPEERERFRQGMRDRCGFGPGAGAAAGPATGGGQAT